MGLDGDDGTLTTDDIPKLAACRDRASEVADALTKCDLLRVTTVDHNPFMGLQEVSSDQALALYREKVAEIIAPVHLIYRATDPDWYAQTAKITAEFCAEAIALIEHNDSAGMSWSG